MTKDEIMILGLEELETRAAEIEAETKTAEPEAFERLTAELEAIEERKAALVLEAEKRKKAADAVKGGAGKPIEERKGSEKMTNKEIRNSKEYIDAYAKYIKTGKDAECRALLTENIEGGTIPVPSIVEGRIRTAWESNKIFSRISKSFVRGNLKIGFEAGATGAELHVEGGTAPDEETLAIGVVSLVPEMIKKWITVSDEVLALGSEEFLAYIYDEIAYHIVKKASEIAIEAVGSAPPVSTATAVGVPTITGAVGIDTIIDAIAALGDDAVNPVIIASGQTIASLKKAALLANYPVDPFQGLEVIQLSAMGSAAIVGDLSGIQANFPEGTEVRFKFDDLSLAERDLVKIVGRLYAAIALVQPGMFAIINGDESGSGPK